MTESIDTASLATIRRKSQQHVRDLTFLADHTVDQVLVKMALLNGMTQSETAKLLGMSKKTVNVHSRTPHVPTGVSSQEQADHHRVIATEFYLRVWGSPDAVDDAFAACRRYDRDRLHYESPWH